MTGRSLEIFVIETIKVRILGGFLPIIFFNQVDALSRYMYLSSKIYILNLGSVPGRIPLLFLICSL